MYDFCINRTEEAYPRIKANDVRKITSLVRHILYLVFFWFAVWSCIAWSVVNGHTILTYTRSSEFFFCVFRLICEFCILFAIFPTVASRTPSEAGSRRGINARDQAPPSHDQWFVYLMDCRCKGVHRCGRHPVSIDLSICQGRQEGTYM